MGHCGMRHFYRKLPTECSKFLDFHYIEDHQKKYKKWLELTERLHYDEDRVYNLYQKIEKLRKNVEKKYKYRKKW